MKGELFLREESDCSGVAFALLLEDCNARFIVDFYFLEIELAGKLIAELSVFFAELMDDFVVEEGYLRGEPIEFVF